MLKFKQSYISNFILENSIFIWAAVLLSVFNELLLLIGWKGHTL